MKQIVIISPNHSDTGPDIQNSSSDHGVTVPRKSIDLVYPNIPVNYYILRKVKNVKTIDAFVKNLKNKYPKNTLYVISTDFSHYTNKQTADKNDKKLLELMQAKAYNQISKLNSSYTDCPECLIIYLKLSDKKFTQTSRLWADRTSYWWAK